MLRCKLLFMFLIQFIFHQFVDASCDKSCLTKSYLLPANSSTSCYGNCQIQVDFSVIEQENFDEYINFTLIGHNFGVSEVRTIGLMLRKGVESTEYKCSKEKSGLTSAYVKHGSFAISKGSSIYADGKLICSWTMSKMDAIWPLISGSKVDLLNDANHEVWLLPGNTTIKVADNLNELPFHKMQFIKCCGYNGNDNYSLIADSKSNSTDFMLQVIGSSPAMVNVKLTDSHNVTITANCDYRLNNVSAYINNATITDQIPLSQARISDHRCSWSLPSIIETSHFTNLNTKKTSYNLQVIADKVSVYNETNVKLISSGQSIPVPVNSCIAFIISIVISWLLI